MEIDKLIEALRYCYETPKNSEEALIHCSQCKYSKGCMPALVDAAYKHLSEEE